MSDPRFKDKPLSRFVTKQEQQRLVRVIEECAEVQKAAAKILRFGPDNHHPFLGAGGPTNLKKFRTELDDLAEAVSDLGEAGLQWRFIRSERPLESTNGPSGE